MSSEAPGTVGNHAGSTPGRACPPHYGYAYGTLSLPAALEADTLYLAGGLYGNLEALDELEAMARRDQRNGQHVEIIFNGDFHWFDADRAWFGEVNERVLAWTSSTGNVELELAFPSPEAGCGCAYPAHVADEVVTRSNDIIARLRAAVPAAERTILGTLPKLINARVGGANILAVHGDTESVAGWRFASEHLPPGDTPLRRRLGVRAPPTPVTWLAEAFRTSGARIIASSHTCLPAYCRLTVNGSTCALLNNGAAGMPNFTRTRHGVATRISVGLTVPPQSIFGFSMGRVRCDAVALEYEQRAWLSRFVRTWPEGTSAHAGYFQRLCDGPDYAPDEAMRDYREREVR